MVGVQGGCATGTGSKGAKRGAGSTPAALLSFDAIAGKMVAEAERAERKRGPHTSSHHSMGVLQEEVFELWDEVRFDDIERAKFEAMQVGAMAMRFIRESGRWAETKPKRTRRVRVKRGKVLK